MGNINIYDSAKNTDANDITSDSSNRIVLRRLQRNNASDKNKLYIQNQNDWDWDRILRRLGTSDTNDEYLYIKNHHEWGRRHGTTYHPEGAYDMRWLGYFIGKNQHLRELNIVPFETLSGSSVRDVLGPFFRGVSNNKSIRTIAFADMDMLGGEMFTMLGPFLKINYNLITVIINDCDFGDEGGRFLALAIGSSTTLQHVELQYNDISEEGMVDILTALTAHRHLQHLYLCGNHLRYNGCVALATLLRSATELQYLDIANNDIDDEGIEALVPALANCSHSEELWIHDNPSITTRGWQRLLCDTTSVNATFLSNHSLSYLGDEIDENETIGYLLQLNCRNDKKEVATIKILKCHNDFDMLPFFQWEFKVLPLVLGWLERASECEMPDDFEPNIEGRKLSTIYQFVRGVPLLYVETPLGKESEGLLLDLEGQNEGNQIESHKKSFISRAMSFIFKVVVFVFVLVPIALRLLIWLLTESEEQANLAAKEATRQAEFARLMSNNPPEVCATSTANTALTTDPGMAAATVGPTNQHGLNSQIYEERRTSLESSIDSALNRLHLMNQQGIDTTSELAYIAMFRKELNDHQDRMYGL